MDTTPVTEPLVPDVAPRPSFPENYLGAVALMLIFFAGGGFTVAYLSNESTTVLSAAQTAAADAQNDPFAALSLDAQAAYVADLTTGKVLYSRNADAQLPLASLTKVALVLAVSEVLRADDVVTVPRHTTPDGAPERLPDGSTWRAQDLIDLTLISSSNEGAQILADAGDPMLHSAYPRSPEQGATLSRMNDLAQGLGLTHTYFLNETGLDASETQAGAYGSARDVGNLFAYAASASPSTFEGTGHGGFVFRSIDGAKVTAVNTDTILGNIPGLVMGKTGTTDLAGGNLAIVFEIGPAHPVVAVVLHSTEEGRFTDMKKLVEATQASIASGGQGR